MLASRLRPVHLGSARLNLWLAAIFMGLLLQHRSAQGQEYLPTWNGYSSRGTAPVQYPTYQASENVVPPPAEPFFSQAVPASHTAGAARCACHTCAAGYHSSPWYLSISGGWADREIVHEAGDPLTFLIFDDGFAANAAVGYRFDPFRVEAEYSFMNQEIETAGSAGLSSSAAGNVNLRALMFNLYHDVQFDIFCWHPYVGAGIGLYQSDINSLYPGFFDVAGAPMAGTAVNTTSDMPFAYQFRLGATRPLSEKTEFYMGYRYFRGEELEFAALPFSNFAPTFHPDGARVHSVELGLRVNFLRFPRCAITPAGRSGGMKEWGNGRTAQQQGDAILRFAHSLIPPFLHSRSCR